MSGVSSQRKQTNGSTQMDQPPDKDVECDLEEKPTRDVTGPRPAMRATERVPVTSTPVRAPSTVLNIEDNLRHKSEIKILRAQLRQTQNEYRNEQELVLQLKRRLNSQEKIRLEESAKINQETVTVQTQAAKLRAEVERTLADKQQVEFDLAKVKRDVISERKMAADRAQRLSEQADALRDQVKTQDRHVQELGHQVTSLRHANDAKNDQHQHEMEQKKKELEVLRAELDLVTSERNKLDTLCLEKDAVIDDANDKIAESEDQIRQQGDLIRKQLAEMALCRDREENTNAELETAEEKLRLLEESVEAERAAHLESKFNSEIVQLKMKDLEGALETEKTTSTETSTNYDQLNLKHRELLDMYHQLKLEFESSTQQYSQLQSEYEQVRVKLSSELDEKKCVIHNLSDQLALHQSNLQQLKDELNKTKQRQCDLEDTYGSSMRELEMLLDNFVLDEESPENKTSPSLVLESLRKTFQHYKKNLNVTCDELSKMKKHCEVLAKECESYKDMIWTKDKALEETQRGYTQASRDLNRLRGEFVECEAQAAQMKAQLHRAEQERDREAHNARAMSEEIERLSRKLQCDEQEHVNYLHSLYQRVVMGRSVSEPKTSVLGSYKWSDLSVMVSEQIDSVISNMNRTDDKLKQLESASRQKDELIQQIQKSHDEQLDKLEKFSLEREVAWQKQKTELEQHYSKLLAEVHVRSKKSQSLADQAWERVRATGSVQQGLEGECLNLTNSLNQTKQQQQVLVCACALLAGAFFPLYARYTNLVSQHKLLTEEAEQAACIYGQARLLVDTLHAELNNSGSKLSPVLTRPGLVRFRVGVVAVLAANRLRKPEQHRSRMFTSYDLSTGLTGLPVWCGGVHSRAGRRGGGPVGSQDGQTGALSWFTDDTLKQIVLSATADIQDVITHASKQGSVVDTKLVLGAARTSFAKLTEQLAEHYPPVEDMVTHRDKTSLVRQLGNGLQKLIMEGDTHVKDYFSPPQLVMTRLQQHVLDLARRLHECEVEKRQINQQMMMIETETQQLRGEASQAHSLQGQLHSLQNQADQMVETSRFEQVCGELNDALTREQHAQKLLTKQAKQIEEITVKLDSFMTDDKENRKTLSETIQSLSQSKLELRHKEQQLRQLNKNVSQLESDNADLLASIKDVEMVLRTTTRDREMLCQYMKNIESSVDQSKHELSKPSHATMRLLEELLEGRHLPGEPGPEVLACKRLVTSFVDTHQQLLSRLVNMESENQLHQQHILSLKHELSAACQRTADTVSLVDLKGGRQTADGRDRDDFTPLQLDPGTPHSDDAPPSPPTKQKHKRSAPATKSLKPVKSRSESSRN